MRPLAAFALIALARTATASPVDLAIERPERAAPPSSSGAVLAPSPPESSEEVYRRRTRTGYALIGIGGAGLVAGMATMLIGFTVDVGSEAGCALGQAFTGVLGGTPQPCVVPDHTRWIVPGATLLSIGVPLLLSGGIVRLTAKRPVRIEGLGATPMLSRAGPIGVSLQLAARF
jgi:hypothetical protein